MSSPITVIDPHPVTWFIGVSKSLFDPSSYRAVIHTVVFIETEVSLHLKFGRPGAGCTALNPEKRTPFTVPAFVPSTSTRTEPVQKLSDVMFMNPSPQHTRH